MNNKILNKIFAGRKLESSEIDVEEKKELYELMLKYGMSKSTAYLRFFDKGFCKWEIIGIINLSNDFLNSITQNKVVGDSTEQIHETSYSIASFIKDFEGNNFYELISRMKVGTKLCDSMAKYGMSSQMTVRTRFKENNWKPWELIGIKTIIEDYFIKNTDSMKNLLNTSNTKKENEGNLIPDITSQKIKSDDKTSNTSNIKEQVLIITPTLQEVIDESTCHFSKVDETQHQEGNTNVHKFNYCYDYRFLENWFKANKDVKRYGVMKDVFEMSYYKTLQNWIQGLTMMPATQIMRFCNYYSVPIECFFVDRNKLAVDDEDEYFKEIQAEPTGGWKDFKDRPGIHIYDPSTETHLESKIPRRFTQDQPIESSRVAQEQTDAILTDSNDKKDNNDFPEVNTDFVSEYKRREEILIERHRIEMLELEKKHAQREKELYDYFLQKIEAERNHHNEILLKLLERSN